MANGQTIPPMVMGPGQHVIKREDAGAEVRTPLQQTLRGALCNVIIYATLTMCALIIGKLSLVISGAAMAAVAVWLAWRWTRNMVGVGIVLTLSVSLLLVAGPYLAEMMWPDQWTLDHWLVKGWAVGGLVLTLVMPFVNGSFRYLSEVADPNGPTAPRSAVAWPGVVWPWQGRQVYEELNYREEEPPARVTHTTKVEVAERAPAGGNGSGQRYTYARFDVDPARMRQVARALADGRAFSERALTGTGLLAGRLEFNQVREEMLEAGLARWKVQQERRQGVELTSKGRAVMRGLAEKSA